MSSDDKYSGSVADTYHNYLVPLIFDAHASDLANRVLPMENASVVETAAGTGVLSEYLSSVLPNSDSLTVTDLSQAMLKVAEHNLAENEDIKFEVASGTELTFDNDSFASVLCQFGIMFFFGSVSWILGGIQSPQTGRGVNI